MSTPGSSLTRASIISSTSPSFPSLFGPPLKQINTQMHAVTHSFVTSDSFDLTPQHKQSFYTERALPCHSSRGGRGEMMPCGPKLWDKSTVKHTAQPGANRYERHSSSGWEDCVFLSRAELENTSGERSHHHVSYTPPEPLAHIPASQGALSIIWIVISDNLTVGSEDILPQLNTQLNQQHWLLAVAGRWKINAISAERDSWHVWHQWDYRKCH